MEGLADIEMYADLSAYLDPIAKLGFDPNQIDVLKWGGRVMGNTTGRHGLLGGVYISKPLENPPAASLGGVMEGVYAEERGTPVPRDTIAITGAGLEDDNTGTYVHEMRHRGLNLLMDYSQEAADAIDSIMARYDPETVNRAMDYAWNTDEHAVQAANWMGKEKPEDMFGQDLRSPEERTQDGISRLQQVTDDIQPELDVLLKEAKRMYEERTYGANR